MAITLKDYSALYKIKDYLANTVAPKYFDLDTVDGTNVGLFGYITEALATNVEDSFFATTMLFKEMFPVTAEDPESIYLMAALFQMSSHFATPASLSFNILIAEDDVVDSNRTTVSGDFLTLNIDRDMLISVDDKNYMLDYDIKIKSKKTTSGYTHTAQYILNDGFTNTISTITSPYIKTTVHTHTENAKRYVLMVVDVHQVTKTTIEDTVLTNDKINIVTKEYPFSGQMANFEIFYRPDASSSWTQMTKYIANSTSVSTSPCCYYSFTDENTLSISFNTDDRYFIPKFNSELKVEIYTTLGADGNFKTYTGEDLSISGVSTKYESNKGLIFIGNVRGSSIGGYDAKTLDELRTEVIKAFSTVKSFTTANDLTLYFNELKLNANNQLLIIKQRDDALKRLFSSFVLFKDDDKNIVPTNTVNIHLPASGFDASYPQSNRYVLNAGKLYSFSGTSTEFVDPRTDITIDSNLDMYETPDKIESVAALPTANLTNSTVYLLTADDTSSGTTKAAGTKWRYDTTNKVWVQYTPYVYINPFLTVLGTNPTLVGYYINTINDSNVVDFMEVNDYSFNQFIVNTIDISRNGLTNDRKYAFTAKLYPTSKLPNPAFTVVTEDTVVTSDMTTFVNPTDGLTYIDNGVIKCAIVFKDSVDNYLELKLTGFNSEAYFMTGSLTTNDFISLSNSIQITSGFKKINGGTAEDQPVMLTSYEESAYLYTFLVYDNTSTTTISHKLRNAPDYTAATITNTYYADANLNFVIPIPEIISTLKNVDAGNGTHTLDLYSVPMIKANIMKTTTDFNTFFTSFRSMYEYVQKAMDYLNNNFEIDLKFFNTYGPSRHFLYFANGDTTGKSMDRVNISITFGVKFAITTGVDNAIAELKAYIKSYIENDTVSLITAPSLYISNLITDIKNNFTNITYFTFNGVNNYDESVQTFESDLNEMNILKGTVATNDAIPEYLNIDYKVKTGVKTAQVIINVL